MVYTFLQIIFQINYLYLNKFTGGRHSINNELIASINQHMEKISSEASYRTIKLCSKISNTYIDTLVRYCNVSKRKAYESFEYKNELCEASFNKYVEKIYKKPHRLTDLCDYCKIGLVLEKEFKNFLVLKFVLNPVSSSKV